MILNQLEEIKNDISGICFAFHGSGCVEGIDDLEADILKQMRKIVGDDFPIGITLDLHTNMSKEMLENANFYVACKMYPHTDCDAAGDKAMNLIIDTIEGKCIPTVGFCPLPMLVNALKASTFNSPGKGIMEYIEKYCLENNLLDASFLHGFPYIDNPNCRASVVTITNDDYEAANNSAMELAKYIWERRTEYDQEFMTPEQAIDIAEKMQKSPIVINEVSDNAGGGTPADGTHLLKCLLEKNLKNSCFGFIYDPEIVKLAIEAGVGNTISGKLGGKTDSFHGEPLPIENAYVKSICDGKYIAKNKMLSGLPMSIGLTVCLVVGNMEIIVASVRSQTFDSQVFRIAGINPEYKRIIALKSTQHFRDDFDKFTAATLSVDTPGYTTCNFSVLPYNNLKRPIYPIDRDTELET